MADTLIPVAVGLNLDGSTATTLAGAAVRERQVLASDNNSNTVPIDVLLGQIHEALLAHTKLLQGIYLQNVSIAQTDPLNDGLEFN
jgi:hypothetical protein